MIYRVVIADDSPEFLSWLRHLLQDSSEFQVVGEASTGKEAARLSKLLTPDLVIADVEMPELDGLDLARCLRVKQPDIRIILTSGHLERAYARLAQEERVLAFIPKVRLSLNSLQAALLTTI